MIEERTKTILTIDDDDVKRYTINRYLRLAGFEIMEAATAQEGMTLALKMPDLIILDVVLPDLDGFEVCRRLKANPVTSSIPILQISAAYVDIKDKVHGLEVGADAYLTSSADPAEWIATIKALLRAREAEETVRELANQWQSTFDAISDGVCLLDLTGRVQRCNRSLLSFLGKSSSEITGSVLNTIVPSPLSKPVFQLLQDVAESRIRQQIEVSYGDRWFSFVVDPVKNDIDELTGIVCVIADISRQKEVERSLREKESDYRLLLNLLPVGVYACDPQGVITHYNREATVLWGNEPIPGDTDQRFCGSFRLYNTDNTILPHDQTPMAQVLKTGEHSLNREVIIERPDSSRITVMVNIAPLRNEQGDLVGAVNCFQDITHRKHLEEILQFLSKLNMPIAASIDQQSTLQKVSSMAVPILADWCMIDIINHADNQMEKIAVSHTDPYKENIANQLRGICTSLDQCSSSILKQVIQTGRPQVVSQVTEENLREIAWSGEHFRIIKELQPISFICVPIITRSKFEGAISLFTSESGRRYSEIDLALADEIARRIAIALENERLFREVSENDRRKDEFLAMLAHELRNPLAAISSGIHLVQKDRLKEHFDWVQDMIARQVNHLTRIIDDLLDVSRITRGKIHLRKERLDIASIVYRAVGSVQEVMQDRRQRLDVNISAQSMQLDADPTRLEQIIVNLLVNAAKYSDQDKCITLTVDNDNGDIVVRVKDQGMGISQEMLAHIFDLFMQGDSSLDRTKGGLGIGLTVVQALTEMHGGSVQAYSEGLGKGSEFVVRLPRACDQRSLKAVENKPVSIHPQPHQLDILVVDDNQDTAVTLTLLLRNAGHYVEMAYDGLETIRSVERHKPEIILMDIGLPEMNGYQVAEHLKANPDTQDIVLVAISGYGQEQDRIRSQQAGFDYHLVKPVDFDELFSILAKSNTNRDRKQLETKIEPEAKMARIDNYNLQHRMHSYSELDTVSVEPIEQDMDRDDSRSHEGLMKEPPQIRAASETSALKILLIEDHKELAQITCEMLMDEGYAVEVALDGQSGIDTAQHFIPDLVFCDLNLPGQLKGYDVAQTLRHTSHQVPYIIALTCHDDEETQERVLQSGFDRYMSKPIDFDILSQVVEQLRAQSGC